MVDKFVARRGHAVVAVGEQNRVRIGRLFIKRVRGNDGATRRQQS